MVDYLSVSDAAVRLGLSARRVRQLAASGELPADRIGRSWAVSAEAVDRRAMVEAAAGRPLAQRNVWRAAGLADELVSRFLADLREAGVESVSSRWSASKQRLADELSRRLGEVARRAAEVRDDPARLARELRDVADELDSFARADLSEGYDLRAMLRFAEVASAGPRQSSVGELDDDLSRLERLVAEDASHSSALLSLRNRYDRELSFRLHPSLQASAAADERFALSGAHAASAYGADLVAGGVLDVYVDPSHLEGVIRDLGLEPVRRMDANLRVRVASESGERRLAPRLIVAADLLDERDPRGRNAAQEILLLIRLSVAWWRARSW